MRWFSWLGGLLVVLSTAATITAVELAHHRATAPHVLVASHQLARLAAYDSLDPGASPPQLIPPPTPTPEAAPPAPAPPAAAAPAPAPPPPTLVIGSVQQALINQDRANNGLAPLTWSSCLYGIARAQAAHLATPGVAFQHYGGAQQDLSCGLGRQAGENIGSWSQGINDTQLNTAFMNSPEHRANILGPYHYVATAWVVAPNGYGYIAVEFS